MKNQSIKNFVEDIAEDCNSGACYIAIIPGDYGLNLEVEVSDAEIAGTFCTNTKNVEKARKLADELQKELQIHGFVVFFDCNEWQKCLEISAELDNDEFGFYNRGIK